MSTKIYDGFIIDGISSIADLNAWLEKARETFEPVRKEYVMSIMSRIAASIHTAASIAESREEFVSMLSHEDDPEYLAKCLIDGHRSIFHTLREYTSRLMRDKHDNFLKEQFSFSFQLLFTKDGKVLGFPFGARQANKISDWLTSLDGYRFYGYWDNVDPDESCSEEEWRQRKEDWEVIGYGPMGEYGLRFEPCIGWVDFMDLANTAQQIEQYWSETSGSFVNRMARQRVIHRETEVRMKGVENAQPSDYMNVINNVREELLDCKSAIYKASKDEREEYESKVPEFTQVHFENKFTAMYEVGE